MFVRTKVFRNRDDITRTPTCNWSPVSGPGAGCARKWWSTWAGLRRYRGEFDRIIETLARLSKTSWVREEAMKLSTRMGQDLGPVLIFGRLWQELGLPDIFARLLAGTAITRDFEEACFAMVLNVYWTHVQACNLGVDQDDLPAPVGKAAPPLLDAARTTSSRLCMPGYGTCSTWLRTFCFGTPRIPTLKARPAQGWRSTASPRTKDLIGCRS